MRKYYLIMDNTFSKKLRLVDSSKWLESRYVELLKTYEAKTYISAIDMAEEDGYEVLK